MVGILFGKQHTNDGHSWYDMATEIQMEIGEWWLYQFERLNDPITERIE